MSIDRTLLFENVREGIMEHERRRGWSDPMAAIVLELIRLVIFNDPTKDCLLRGHVSDWNGLPPTKSLFRSKPGCGLPIGNLTSQLFSNVYLNRFDHFVKQTLGLRWYGRYVDDFVLVHRNKGYLKSAIPAIREFLADELKLELHPDKVYLQRFTNGVSFLGAHIKPYRTYLKSRTKGRMYSNGRRWNKMVGQTESYPPSEACRKEMLSSMNSYLGLAIHYRTYKLRKALLTRRLSPLWWNFVRIGPNFGKVVARPGLVPFHAKRT